MDIPYLTYIHNLYENLADDKLPSVILNLNPKILELHGTTWGHNSTIWKRKKRSKNTELNRPRIEESVLTSKQLA